MSLRWDVFWVFALVHDLQGWGGWVIPRRLRVTFWPLANPPSVAKVGCRRPMERMRPARKRTCYASERVFGVGAANKHPE